MKNLVILRCGPNSLHRDWLQGAERRFDLALCPYQDVPAEPEAIHQSSTIPGQKWDGLHRFMREWPQWREYDYIWLPDDDLATDAFTINALFLLSARMETTISAPALSEDSYFSHHMTLRNRRFFARAVAFIEVMMPCFRRDVLELALPSIATTKTGYGWGLDYVWPVLVNYRNMVIFDCIAVRHTRPVGGEGDPDLLRERVPEMDRLLAQYAAPKQHKVLGGYDATVTFRAAEQEGFLPDFLDGYRHVIERDARALPILMANHKLQLPRLPAAANLALGRDVLMSSRDSNWAGPGFSTAPERDPWWQVDLGAEAQIGRVLVFAAAGSLEDCTRFSVSSSADGRDWTIQAVKLDGKVFGADGRPYVFSFSPAFSARYVRITHIGDGALRLAGVEVYGPGDAVDPGLVVALRTHLWTPEAALLARRLAAFSQGARFVILADESAGVLPTAELPKIAHTGDFSWAGLPNFPAGQVLWYNADYPLYALRQALPAASHYAMVEYDVAVNLDILPMLRAARDRGIDLIAAGFEESRPEWHFHDTVAGHFARPIHALLPFIVVSGRAIDAMRAARLASAKGREITRRQDWPFCEGFIPSAVAAMEGAVLAELGEFARLAHFTWRPERHLKDPEVNQPGTISHPVAGGEMFVRRRLRHEAVAAILDPESKLRAQLRFCDPAEFAGACYEWVREKGTAGMLEAFVALAREQGWGLEGKQDVLF